MANRLDRLKTSIAQDRAKIREISQKKFNDENFDMLASSRKLKFMYQQFETIRRSENFSPAVEAVLAEVSESFRLLDFDDLDVGQIDAFIESLEATKVMAKAAIDNKGTRSKIEKIVSGMQHEAASISAGTIFKERLTAAAKNFVGKMFDFTGIVSWVSKGNPLLTSMARMAQESYGASKQRKKTSASAQAQAQIRVLNARKQLSQKMVSRVSKGLGGSGKIRIGGLSNTTGSGGFETFTSAMAGGGDINDFGGSGSILGHILEQHVETNKKLDALIAGGRVFDDKSVEDIIESGQRRRGARFIKDTPQGPTLSSDNSGLDEMAPGGITILGGGLIRGVFKLARFLIGRGLPVVGATVLAYELHKSGMDSDKIGQDVGEGFKKVFGDLGKEIGMSDSDVQALADSAKDGTRWAVKMLQTLGGLSKEFGQKIYKELGIEEAGGAYQWAKGGMSDFMQWASENPGSALMGGLPAYMMRGWGKGKYREPDFDAKTALLGDMTQVWEGGRNPYHIENESDGTKSYGMYGLNEKGMLPKFVQWAQSRGINTGGEFSSWANPDLQKKFFYEQQVPEYIKDAITTLGGKWRSRLTGKNRRGISDYIVDMYNTLGSRLAQSNLKEAFAGIDPSNMSDRELILRLRDVRYQNAPMNFKSSWSDKQLGITNRIMFGANQAMRVDEAEVERNYGYIMRPAETYQPSGAPVIQAAPSLITPAVGAQNSAPQPEPVLIPFAGNGAEATSFWRATFENYVPHTVR